MFVPRFDCTLDVVTRFCVFCTATLPRFDAVRVIPLCTAAFCWFCVLFTFDCRCIVVVTYVPLFLPCPLLLHRRVCTRFRWTVVGRCYRTVVRYFVTATFGWIPPPPVAVLLFVAFCYTLTPLLLLLHDTFVTHTTFCSLCCDYLVYLLLLSPLHTLLLYIHYTLLPPLLPIIALIYFIIVTYYSIVKYIV